MASLKPGATHVIADTLAGLKPGATPVAADAVPGLTGVTPPGTADHWWRRPLGRPLAVHRTADFLALTKPRVNLLVLITTVGAYYLGLRGAADLSNLFHAVLGTALVAGGAAAINQIWERRTDALMRRTRARPVAAGRLRPLEASVFAGLLSVVGVTELALGVNPLAAAVASLTLLAYALVYTPLKRRTWLSTLAGAVPGALPPVVGWAAATGTISTGGWTLFAIVFLWQIPHFLAIAWIYRDDYERAGFPMLPVIEPDGRSTGRHALAYSIALVPASVLPALYGLAGGWYAGAALALSAALVVLAARFAAERSRERARALFFGSIAYLPLVWGVMIVDRVMVTSSVRFDITYLATLNAMLNASSGVLLTIGYLLIRRGRVAAHRRFMISAFGASALFLVSYVIYHANAGSKPFEGQGWVRPVYFTILISHVVLAAVVLPMAIVTLCRGLAGRYDRHVRIARWTFPLWLYVSVTGVIVYFMLYHWS